MIKIFYCNSDDNNIPKEISEYRINKILCAKKDRQAQLNTAKALKAGFASFGVNEQQVIYGLSANKKPYAINHPDIHFSISHSEYFSIIAFYNHKIGIDCEKTNRSISKETLSRFFSSDNISYYDSSRLSLWVAKEAFVKYTGKGLALGRNEYNIPFFTDEHEADGMYFKRFEIEGFECALCTDRKDEIIITKI